MNGRFSGHKVKDEFTASDGSKHHERQISTCLQGVSLSIIVVCEWRDTGLPSRVLICEELPPRPHQGRGIPRSLPVHRDVETSPEPDIGWLAQIHRRQSSGEAYVAHHCRVDANAKRSWSDRCCELGVSDLAWVWLSEIGPAQNYDSSPSVWMKVSYFLR